MASRPAAPSHILETCLYVRSMDKAVAFYHDILGLAPDLSTPRLTTFAIGTTTLILFQLGLCDADTNSTSPRTGEKLTIPSHGPDPPVVDVLLGRGATAAEATEFARGDDRGADVGSGSLRTHYCLAVPTREEVTRWEEYLNAQKVTIRGVMDWERGGRSVYFEDVDGHVGEIGSRGIWDHW